eukprot:GHVH01012849.1.p1 GENE.GHVH01012849.1~~GHVH01012849.1.p1  ORF type:complete len:342 (+),score=39.15 GHVH01012849.1:25-1050(+)
MVSVSAATTLCPQNSDRRKRVASTLSGHTINSDSHAQKDNASDCVSHYVSGYLQLTPAWGPSQQIGSWANRGGGVKPQYLPLWEYEAPQEQTPYESVPVPPHVPIDNRIYEIVTGRHRELANRAVNHVKTHLLKPFGNSPTTWAQNITQLRSAEGVEQTRRCLKNKLREHDSAFLGVFGYQPSKFHKELLRPLYILYRELKPESTSNPLRNLTSKDFCRSPTLKASPIHSKLPPAQIAVIPSEARPSSHLPSSGDAMNAPINGQVTNDDLRKWRSNIKVALVEFATDFSRRTGRDVFFKGDILPVEPLYQRYKVLQAEIQKREPRKSDRYRRKKGDNVKEE